MLLRVLDKVVFLLTAGFALMTFDAVRQYGISLFASAGVAGLAARPVLSNLFAGIQLAVTQPIRIERAVTVENEYGWIEEITSSYVVILLWDLRRLIVPLSYFIKKPRRAANIIGGVLLYVPMRRRLTASVKGGRARGAVAGGARHSRNVQVTNTSLQGNEVRILINADSAANASNLCAELREKLIAFLVREHPEALPRRRVDTLPPQPRA